MKQKSDMISLSVVVPVYRSADVLHELVSQVHAALAGSTYDGHFELVLVNDCSPDESWELIERQANEHAWIRGVSLRRNFGQHNATMAGLKYARGKIVVIMDDDLQHPPTAILRLAEMIEKGFDVCYTRYKERKHATWKKLGSRFNDIVAGWVLNKPRGLYLSSFKALSRGAADAILAYDGPYAYVDGLIFKVTNSITTIDIDHQDRFAGQGNYNLKRSVSLWLKMATGSSVYPLRIATVFGFAMAATSLVLLAIIVVDRLRHPEMQPGWASTIATILMMGGLQMFFLGILGEYIGRIYIRLNNTPQYVVRETTFSDHSSAHRSTAIQHHPV
ncbi:glycosyltransferase [Mesorhizobium sp. M2A.F.Ca.ET.043.05.1.1]|uniref:glycosyltransferase family 2 protein n=1 Tax=Mesorhizobium sp. M2A.F.Ca.ET.043.05.1.1 TaxID=2493671 RepID=UPI000F7529B2|nr:glycosyltransferase family 2 protein [Mesorhizobium sp. M2A.F.Ca.ET.043.05.1.1]AZO17353.1 glycosyltransferase [Mesorhizobium sp. M2A.F.Ca.ET.043.05.1.1]TIW18322.1 MAG: glycosyltransferase family 2 protein [Mesorhizobium sp.]